MSHHNPAPQLKKMQSLCKAEAHRALELLENYYTRLDDAEEKESIDGWMNSPKHKAVILNEGIWKEMKWTKIGGAAYGPFANVWFSE